MTALLLTPAQRRGLALLARPGAVAHSGTLVRWGVFVDNVKVGSVHAESLAALRGAGLVEMFHVGAYPQGFHHRITENGRACLAAAPGATTNGGGG